MSHGITAKLINRDEQRKKIRACFAQVGQGKFFFAGLEFHGIGGLGKSRTLEIAKEESRNCKEQFIVIDFLPNKNEESKHLEIDILLRICDHFDLDADFTSGRILISSLLRNGEVVQPDQILTGKFQTYLSEALKDHPLILMLDSIEYCPEKTFDWLGRVFLEPLVKEQKVSTIMVFLAGRGPRVEESRWPASLKGALVSMRLDPLDFQATEQHLSALSENMEYWKAAKEIYALSNGHPYSTETIVSWLSSLGIKVEEVKGKRKELANQLREEVIHRYLLSDANDWTLPILEAAGHFRWIIPFLEIASYFRWFSSGFLSKFVGKYRPDLGKNQPMQWYTERLVDLQKRPLHFVSLGKDHYLLEPTLRKLLHITSVILNPEESLAIHREAIDVREQELQTEQVSHTDNVRAAIVVEILYHFTHLAAIEGKPIKVKSELKRLLGKYFEPNHPRDLETLGFLKNLLDQDPELRELLTQAEISELLGQIDAFLAPPPTPASPFQPSYLNIDFNSPAEYRVSWYQANQVVVPTERVNSAQRFQLKDWREMTQDVGRAAFAAYLPRRAQDFIRRKREWAIQLSTNRTDIPWELLHDGTEYLCLSRPMARRPQQLIEPKEAPPRAKGSLRALVIGNPTSDLPGAEAEAQAVAEALSEAGAQVDLLLKEKATARRVAIALPTKEYDLIHFAGHGYFQAKAAGLSGLQFADVAIFAEELERYLDSRTFVFLSACDAGRSRVQSSRSGYIGEFIEGLATSVLLGGAIGCLGPMWEIGDNASKEFALEFYMHLLAGKPIGEATRQARLSVSKKSVFENAWKAWILYGDPLQEISFTSEY